MTQQRRYQFGEVYYSGRSATGKIMRGTLVNHQRDHLVFAPDLMESTDGGQTWNPAEGRVLSEQLLFPTLAEALVQKPRQ